MIYVRLSSVNLEHKTKSFDFPIFSFLAYPMKDIPEMRRVHYIWHLEFDYLCEQLFLIGFDLIFIFGA
jgi:hypothetical protein